VINGLKSVNYVSDVQFWQFYSGKYQYETACVRMITETSGVYDQLVQCQLLVILILITVGCHQCFDAVGWGQEGHPHPACWKYGGWWRWALVSPDGVAPSRMVGVSAFVNSSLHHKVQKFPSGTGSPGCSQKKGRKTVVACGGGTVEADQEMYYRWILNK